MCNNGIMENNIKKIRKERGLSQRKLSKLLGVDAGQVSRLESGQTKLHSEWIKKLSPILDCTASELLGEQVVLEGDVIDVSIAPSKETMGEIMWQVYYMYPDASFERIVAVVLKVYEELKGDRDIDPAYVRGFFKSINRSNLL